MSLYYTIKTRNHWYIFTYSIIFEKAKTKDKYLSIQWVKGLLQLKSKPKL